MSIAIDACTADDSLVQGRSGRNSEKRSLSELAFEKMKRWLLSEQTVQGHIIHQELQRHRERELHESEW